MNHYETLGIAKDATPNDIEKAYRKAAAWQRDAEQSPPNAFGDIDGEWRDKLKEINARLNLARLNRMWRKRVRAREVAWIVLNG